MRLTAQGGNNALARAVELEDDIMYRHCKVFMDFYELEVPLGLTEQERDMLPDLMGKVEASIKVSEVSHFSPNHTFEMSYILKKWRFYSASTLVSHCTPNSHK